MTAALRTLIVHIEHNLYVFPVRGIQIHGREVSARNFPFVRYKSSKKMTTETPMEDVSRFFKIHGKNQFKSVRATVEAEVPVDQTKQFAGDLSATLEKWKAEGLRGVWLTLSLPNFHLAPVCRNLGFRLHHCSVENDTLLMNIWLLDDRESSMPRFTSHTVGVAGCVVDEENGKVLLVRDTSRPEIWKFPGGFSDPNEDLEKTAEREVFEETGIHTEFQSILAFRQHHNIPSSFNMSDIYIICRMKVRLAPGADKLNFEPSPCPNEIVECRWRDIDEVLAVSDITPLMRRLLTIARLGVTRGFDTVDIGAEHFKSIHPGKTYGLFHRPLPSE